ncbi:MAG TPA: zinc-ribbon domain-containing protein [Propionibacteriaceae bacterium]|nr:zinc-ribbon domain-containing protein [Propionibacteriaceae bacterium]
MLIFGLGVSEVLLATLFFACETCGNNGAHQLLKRVRKLSLFFIPIFPLSTRYFDSCSACGRMLEVSREQATTAARQSGPGLR